VGMVSGEFRARRGNIIALYKLLEHTHIELLLHTKRIILYTRYIDEIVIICDAEQINLDTITRYANSINSNLELNPTPENNNRVNFLDLTIIRNTLHLKIYIYGNNTTHCYSTTPHVKKIPLSRQLLKMGTRWPETC